MKHKKLSPTREISTTELEDVVFLKQYLEYTSRRSASPTARARAALLLAAFGMLDRELPGWWGVLMTRLAEDGQLGAVPKALESATLLFGPDSMLSRALEHIMSSPLEQMPTQKGTSSHVSPKKTTGDAPDKE